MRSIDFNIRMLIVWGTLWMLSSHTMARDTVGVTFYTDSKLLLKNIEQTPYQATSTAVDTIRLLLDELNYTQPPQFISLPRAFAQIEAGERVCVLNKIRNPEREGKFSISLPQNFFQSVRLYQLAELEPISETLLNEQGHVLSLNATLGSFPSSAIILPRDFSYGEALDSDIDQANQEQIIHLPNDVYFERFMQLFFKHKVGFALIFPSTYYRALQFEPPVPIREYKVTGIPAITSGHILCGKNDMGQHTIKIINEAMRRVYQKPEFLEAHLNYLPQQSRQPIRSAIEQVRQDH